MPQFAARIELNGPPPASIYLDLRDQLSRNLFFKTITGDSGKTWLLPDAMYVGILATDDIEEARRWLEGVIETVWLDYELIVFAYDNAAWTGLTQLV